MINQHELLKRDQTGKIIGVNQNAIKYWILDNVPHHSDLEPYVLVHTRLRHKYFDKLADQLTTEQVIHWRNEIRAAVIYLERLLDIILEHDETTYECDLRHHHNGEVCPNRAGVVLPDP